MNRKQELIELIMGIVTPGNADRKTLELHTIPELEAIYDSANLEAINDQEEQLLQDKAKAAAQRAMADLAKQQLDEIRRPQHEAQQRESEVADRRTFADAARKLRFSICEANFNIIRQTLGANFSVRDIEDIYLRLGVGIELIGATPQELNTWENERIQDRNQYLKTADSQTLRTEAKHEAVQNRNTAAQTAFEKELEAGLIRDINLPQLPGYWTNGKRIDPDFIRRADKELLRLLVRRFGSSRLSARLHGITRIGNFTLD